MQQIFNNFEPLKPLPQADKIEVKAPYHSQ